MGNAIGQILAFGVGIAISPIPIIGVVLILTTPKARSNGPAFLLGWILGLAAAGTVVLLIAGGADASTGGSAGWATVLKLILGIALIVLAAKQWRSRPGEGEEPTMPGWVKSIDEFTPGRSAAFGAALAAVNPKNLILVVGGAVAISETGASAGSQAIALIVFIVIATLGTGVPVALYFGMGERARPILDDLKGRMAQNNAAILAVICLILGAKLLGDALTALSA